MKIRVLPVASAALTVAFLTSACTSSDPRAAADDPAAPAPAAERALDQTKKPNADDEATTYKTPADPCAAIDDTALSAVLGPGGKTEKGGLAPDAGPLTVTHCDRPFGRGGARVGTAIELQIGDAGIPMESMFTGVRKVKAQTAELTDVPGLGQGAYSYGESTGPHLVAYDGNLYMTVTVYDRTTAATPGSKIEQAMIETVRATMAKLRA
ncbi:hypothetical protein [Actinoplanes sp. M2I2]|uniref:hypothetical protein n=1 Tax=Actinoplanes sp. M2I2 TaxID=1734444 RepID=UPI00202163C8|nr:hypothetical protein [Actinoplanes sp. M2I2]